MQSLLRTLLELSYDSMMTLLIHTDVEISVLSCQGFSYNIIFSLLSDQLRHISDNLYQARIMGRDKLISSTVDETASIMWSTI